MDNVSKTSTSFVLLGLVEMESMKHLYFALSLLMFLSTMFLCSLILFVILNEESLHEPMYLFISNLIFNGMLGSIVLFPKLMVDLLSGNIIISLEGCLAQAYGVQLFASAEFFTFTVMAHDRYMAVGQPLRYRTLMTNGKAFMYLGGVWFTAFILVLMPILLTARLQMCGLYINNIVCDNMSLVTLACGDTSVNNIVGSLETSLLMITSLVYITYTYIMTIIICLKISKEAGQKALRTLMTHLVAFSCFLITVLFIIMRYRMSKDPIPLLAHVLLAVSGLITSSTLNPLIYGIRTEGLKVKIIQNLKKLNIWRDLNKTS